MSAIQNSEPKTEYSIKGIELLKSSINTPDAALLPVANFQFSISVESRLDPSAKLIFVIVNIDVMSEDQPKLASIGVSCIYQVVNFDESIKQDAENQYVIPSKLMDALAATSFSTTRGIMFSMFKGTFLHSAILPLLDNRKFAQQ